jgi:hypothetical protein
VVIKKYFALAFLRHERTPTQIENNEESDLRQVLHILSNDFLDLVGDDISADDVQDFLQYFNNTWMGRLRFWKVKTEHTATELEQNLMNQEAIIVPLTKKLKDKERRLARSKQRYNGNEITLIEYVLYAFLI